MMATFAVFVSCVFIREISRIAARGRLSPELEGGWGWLNTSELSQPAKGGFVGGGRGGGGAGVVEAMVAEEEE